MITKDQLRERLFALFATDKGKPSLENSLIESVRLLTKDYSPEEYENRRREIWLELVDEVIDLVQSGDDHGMSTS